MSFWKKVVLGLKYGIFCVFFAFSVSLLYDVTTKYLGLTLPENETQPVFKLLEEAFQNKYLLLFIVFFVTIVGPLIEEIMFRWFPITVTKFCTNNKIILWTVIVVASVIFGYLHGILLLMFITGVLGLLFSHAFLRGGIISSWVAHSFFNTVGTLVLLIQLYSK